MQTSDFYTSIRVLYKHKTIIQASDYYTSIRLLYKHQIITQASDCYTSIRLVYKPQIIKQASDRHTKSSDHQIISSDQHIIIFFRASGWHWETCTQIRSPKTIKMDLNRVHVAPFGPKLCQNVAPRLRIIFQALLGPKTQLKNTKTSNIIKIPIFTVQIMSERFPFLC